VQIVANLFIFDAMILVTGGTGLVGAHLLAALSKNNDKIRQQQEIR